MEMTGVSLREHSLKDACILPLIYSHLSSPRPVAWNINAAILDKDAKGHPRDERT